MSTLNYSSLKNIHTNKLAYIVGKGPSLHYLSADYFKDDGIVIVLNDALLVIEKLSLSLPIFSLQKDGNPNFMVEPSSASRETTLVLQNTPGYSRDYYPKYNRRILVDPVLDQGFNHIQVMASRMAIAMAIFMGCSYIKMLCFDILTNGNMETYNPKLNISAETIAAKYYKLSKYYVLFDLQQIKHEFITPEK